MDVWFNPACSKCRMTTAALDEAGVTYTLRRYLDDPPTAGDLREALNHLGLEPWDITRMNEARATELGLADLPHDREQWIAVLSRNPILIQRPIVVTEDGSAWIARDEATVATVVDHGRAETG